jgi:SAM-dependent methyltransferase
MVVSCWEGGLVKPADFTLPKLRDRDEGALLQSQMAIANLTPPRPSIFWYVWRQEIIDDLWRECSPAASSPIGVDDAMAGPTIDFWQERYRSGQTGWDRGGANAQLLAWLEAGILRPPARIVVPGCGSGWEVAELARRGFEVTAIDYAEHAVERTRQLLAGEGLSARVLQADVLAWQPDSPFDAVYEQTCLCALHPDRWIAYADALHRWLAPGGHLFALFMQALKPEAAAGFVQGPPYHCDINAMRALFDAARWEWETPPFPQVTHPNGGHEIAVRLRAR